MEEKQTSRKSRQEEQQEQQAGLGGGSRGRDTSRAGREGGRLHRPARLDSVGTGVSGGRPSHHLEEGAGQACESESGGPALLQLQVPSQPSRGVALQR